MAVSNRRSNNGGSAPSGASARWPRLAQCVRLCALPLLFGILLLPGCATRKHEAFDAPGVGHEKGNPEAKVVIVEFIDFGCPACAQFARETLPRVERDWISTGRARIRVLPFDALKTGRVAARAAECAGQQNAFWPMHDVLYARQKEWIGHLKQRPIFQAWAAELHLDMKRFDACWNSNLGRKRLQQNNKLARSSGVPGTPAFSVNGKPLVGALPYGEFKLALERAAHASGSSTAMLAPAKR